MTNGRKKLWERSCYCPSPPHPVSPSAGSRSSEQLLFPLDESQNDFQSFHSFWHKGYRRLFRLLPSQELLELHSAAKHGMAAAKKTIRWRGKQPVWALVEESHTRGKGRFWAARCLLCTEGLRSSGVPLEVEKGPLFQPPKVTVTCGRARCLASASAAVSWWWLVNAGDTLTLSLLKAVQKDFLILLEKLLFFFPPLPGKVGLPSGAPQRCQRIVLS